MADTNDNAKKNPTPTDSVSADLALSSDADDTTGNTSPEETSTAAAGDDSTIGGSTDEGDGNSDELTGAEETGFNLYQGVDEEIKPSSGTKKSEEEAFLDAIAMLTGQPGAATSEKSSAPAAVSAADEKGEAPDTVPKAEAPPAVPANDVPRPEAQEPVKAGTEAVRETEETIANREKIKTVYPDLDRMLADLPADSYEQVDSAELRNKVAQSKFDTLSIPELRALVKLEMEEPGFGQSTGFKGTEAAFRKINQWINPVVVESHALLAKAGMTRGAGSPITVSTVGTDPQNPGKGFAHRPETFDALFVNGELSLPKLLEMQRSGQLDSKLILEPKGIPTTSDIAKMGNSLDWLNNNRERLKEGSDRIYANGCSYLLTDILKITDKPGWQPPRDSSKLEAYNLKMTENLNLMFSVRNYAEAIQSLNNVGGDFKSKALENLQKLGVVEWDQDKRKITKLELKLPDSLESTPENERVLQKLRDWIRENRGPVDQALKEYEKGNPLRFGDVPMKGTVGQDGRGNIVYVKDERGQLQSFISGDKQFNRNIYGALVDANGTHATDSQIASTLDSAKEVKEFDYITQSFSTKNSADTVDVQSFKNYYKDHLLNQQNLLGLPRGETLENFSFKPWEHVLTQSSTGRLELSRADRLEEVKLVQGLFHYGSKALAIGLDLALIAGGGIGVKAALATGSRLGLASNGFRVALGVAGFLDPGFRQMGETGELIRDVRHKAILLDVTQGLGRQMAGKLLGGGVLFQGKGAAEMAKVIEGTAWMHRTELATRGVFLAADGVYLPIMSSGMSAKVERMRGHDPARQLRNAVISRGSGVGDDGTGFAKTDGGTGFTKADGSTGAGTDGTVSDATGTTGAGTDGTGFGADGKQKFDAVKSAKSVFTSYQPLIANRPDSQSQVKSIFDKTVKALEGGEEQIAALRDKELVGLFNPSGDALQQWKRTHGHKPAGHVQPGVLTPEKSANKSEQVANAISLLFLAQKNGTLPEDGVIARRNVVVPEYTYSVPSGAPEAPPVDVTVPSETIEQKVTIDQVLGILQNAALDNSDPSTQFAAADALWRSGAISTGKYSGVCLDILKSESGGVDKAAVLKQFSDLVLLKRIEENDPTVDPESRARAMADSYGLSEQEQLEKLTNFALNSKDADLGALALAVVFSHDLRVKESSNDVSPSPKQTNAFDRYYRQWQQATGNGQPVGTFKNAFVAEQLAGLDKAIAGFDKTNSASWAEHDQEREERFRVIRNVIALEKGAGGEKYTKVINDSLMSLVTADVTPPRPNLNLTMDAFNLLLDRRDKLSIPEKTKLAEAALNILDIKLLPDSSDPKLAKVQGRANYESAQAQLLIIGQLSSIFEGKDLSNQRIFVEDAISQNYLSPVAITKGWGQHAAMRVAAIEGLTSLGKGDGDGNIRIIADRLKSDESGYFERDPYVRTAALKAINKLEPALFSASQAELANKKLPDIRPENLLRFERDPAAVETLYAVHDTRRAYQDPDSLPAVSDYSAEVEALLSGAKTTITGQEVLAWIKANSSKFGLLDQNAVMEKARQNAASHLWSGIDGWLSWVSKSSETVKDKEECRANNVEKFRIRSHEREKQFAELTNFKNLQPADQEMAIKTLLYIIKNPDQQLFQQDEQVEMRIKASKALASLAKWQELNNDRVENKDLLTACVVTALTKSGEDLPGEAKLYLLDAMNSMVKRDHGVDFSAGKGVGYKGLSPTRAGAIFTQVLKQESSQFTKVSAQWGKAIAAEHHKLRTLSNQVQLACINGIYDARYMGAFAVLRARGPDKVLDPANPGSYLHDVNEQSKIAVESLYYGTSWLRQDAAARLTGTPEGDAKKIASQLLGDQPQHYQFLIADMFASAKDQSIASANDQRVAVLQHALNHPNQRVRLASAIILSESKLPQDAPVKVASLNALQELTGRRSTDQQRSNEKQPSKDQLSSNEKQPLRGFDIWRMEASDALLRAKASEYPNARIANVDALLYGVGWMRNGGTKFGAEVNETTRANMMLDRLSSKQSSDFNHEKIAMSIVSACADKPIVAAEDPRRAVLSSALKHPEERVRLAAAWMMSESAIAIDREDGVKTLAAIATRYGTNTAGSEARQILSSIINVGSVDDQVLAYSEWKRAYGAGHNDGAAAPELIPTNSMERRLAYFMQAPKSELDYLIQNGSAREKELVIQAMTGWSTFDMQAHVKARHEELNPPSKADEFKRISPLQNMQSCIGAGPKKQESFRLSLFEDGFDPLTGSRDDWRNKLGYGKLTPAEVNAGLDSVLKSLKGGEKIVQKNSLRDSGGNRDPEISDIDWQRFRTLSRMDWTIDRLSGSSGELTNLLDRLKKATSGGVSEPASWKPAVLIDRPQLNQPEKSPVMSDAEIERIHNGTNWLEKGIRRSSSNSFETDANLLAGLLADRQPNNGRATVEQIFSSFYDRPIESEADPRRREILKGLSNDSERVQLASAWVLSSSTADGDFRQATQRLSQLAVTGRSPIAREEAQSLLQDMITLGGDVQKDIALAAWRRAYESAGSQRSESSKPPTFTELDQARKFLKEHGNDKVLRKTYDERKAILLHMLKASDPIRPMTDEILETWLQPSDFTPVLDSSLALFDSTRFNKNTNPFDRESNNPFILKYDVVTDPFGMRTPEVQSAGYGFNRGGNVRIAGWNGAFSRATSESNDLETIMPDKRGSSNPAGLRSGKSSAAYGDAGSRFRFNIGKELQTTLDSSELKSTIVTLGDRNEIVLKVDSSLLGGRNKSSVTISGDDREDAVKFMAAASPELTALFAKELLESRPGLRADETIPAQDLAIMFKNWIDQKMIGRATPVISETFNEPIVEEMTRLPLLDPGFVSLKPKVAGERWSELSKKRERYREERVNSMILDQLREPQMVLDEKPHWKPISKGEIKPPKFISEAPLNLLDRYSTDVVAILPSEVFDAATARNEIKVSTLRRMAQSAQADGDLVMAPGLVNGDSDMSFSITDPRDQAIINTLRLQRIQRRLNYLNANQLFNR